MQLLTIGVANINIAITIIAALKQGMHVVRLCNYLPGQLKHNYLGLPVSYLVIYCILLVIILSLSILDPGFKFHFLFFLKHCLLVVYMYIHYLYSKQMS